MNPKSLVYLGLDLATISGIALWHPFTHTAEVVQVKGDPIETFAFLARVIMPLLGKFQPTVCMEQSHHFINAKTTRSLLERYGFIKYSLMCNYKGMRIEEPNLNSIRASLGARNKKEMMGILATRYTGPYLTDNHTDALACCIYQSKEDGIPFTLGNLHIVSITPKEETK
jgi:hypothetical protein